MFFLQRFVSFRRWEGAMYLIFNIECMYMFKINSMLTQMTIGNM